MTAVSKGCYLCEPPTGAFMRRLFLCLTWAASLPAQSRLERIASTAADTEIGSIGAVAASRSGWIYTTDRTARQIVVYDSTGRRVRTMGRRGSGPLEFQELQDIAWLGDTLVAYDAAS